MHLSLEEECEGVSILYSYVLMLCDFCPQKTETLHASGPKSWDSAEKGQALRLHLNWRE